MVSCDGSLCDCNNTFQCKCFTLTASLIVEQSTAWCTEALRHMSLEVICFVVYACHKLQEQMMMSGMMNGMTSPLEVMVSQNLVRLEPCRGVELIQ